MTLLRVGRGAIVRYQVLLRLLAVVGSVVAGGRASCAPLWVERVFPHTLYERLERSQCVYFAMRLSGHGWEEALLWSP